MLALLHQFVYRVLPVGVLNDVQARQPFVSRKQSVHFGHDNLGLRVVHTEESPGEQLPVPHVKPQR
jgi:hypothetical protein